MELVSKISNICGPDERTLQMDVRTYGGRDDMQTQYRAFHYSASRDKNVLPQEDLNYGCSWRVSKFRQMVSATEGFHDHVQPQGMIPRRNYNEKHHMGVGRLIF